MKKTILAIVKSDADAVEYSDGQKRLEITGPDQTAARLSEGGIEKLFREQVVPFFSEGSQKIEIVNSSGKIIWEES